ncbi:hypothetical protein AJ80_07443 [Polytolypa hystricis UAMH7299]|uniref:RRM domain-containing protein n=1 Tax=Polytolypa hystricis (strain UAMH7299) TaxID=1447883 RepID=A0A2B7XQB1_POLH7|nr:hypothetical protein AJ80_07443 [Polytolypa hystricis UAMH7299]
MSDSENSPPPVNRKRKLDDGPALEIDLSAPEPPSKKALRKAKKKQSAAIEASDPAAKPTTKRPIKTDTTTIDGTENAVPKRSEYGVWIGNLPFTVTKEDLQTFIVKSGSIEKDSITRLHMPEGAKQHGRAQNKGFAYVDFTHKGDMEKAIGLSEQLLGGRRVLIKDAKNFSGRPDKPQNADGANSSKQPAHPPSRKIFVGNLGFDVTKEIVEKHFKPCGTISNVHIATFEDSGKCKGYAWVEFEEVEASEAAVRGFVKVAERDAEEEEEEEEQESSDEKAEAKNKKQKMRKVWVNRIMGRPLRMEFAEDSATRYKKRFSKEKPGEGPGQAHSNDAPAIEEVPAQNDSYTKGADRRQFSKHKRDPKPSVPSRYAEDVVQRLSGAIVESKGKKITFD